MSSVLHTCTSLFILPLSLNKVSVEKPSFRKNPVKKLDSIKLQYLEYSIYFNGNMLYVIPVVPSACAFVPRIHCVLWPIRTLLSMTIQFYVKKETENGCGGSLLYSNKHTYISPFYKAQTCGVFAKERVYH